MDLQIKIKTKVEENKLHRNHSIREWKKSTKYIKMIVNRNIKLFTGLVEEAVAKAVNIIKDTEDPGRIKMMITNIKITITKNSRKYKTQEAL